VWVNNFQAPEIQAVLSSFFMTVMILQVAVLGVVGGGWRVVLIQEYKMEYEDN